MIPNAVEYHSPCSDRIGTQDTVRERLFSSNHHEKLLLQLMLPQ
jgi:hypothetical protein